MNTKTFHVETGSLESLEALTGKSFAHLTHKGENIRVLGMGQNLVRARDSLIDTAHQHGANGVVNVKYNPLLATIEGYAVRYK